MKVEELPSADNRLKNGDQVYVPELRLWARLTGELYAGSTHGDDPVFIRWFTASGFIQYATVTLGEIELEETPDDTPF